MSLRSIPPKHDTNTFAGRYLHFLDVIDPRCLFVGNKRLAKAVKLVDDYENGRTGPSVTIEQVWHAQKIKSSILHPDSGDVRDDDEFGVNYHITEDICTI